jgi:hypothetical protein
MQKNMLQSRKNITTSCTKLALRVLLYLWTFCALKTQFRKKKKKSQTSSFTPEFSGFDHFHVPRTFSGSQKASEMQRVCNPTAILIPSHTPARATKNTTRTSKRESMCANVSKSSGSGTFHSCLDFFFCFPMILSLKQIVVSAFSEKDATVHVQTKQACHRNSL